MLSTAAFTLSLLALARTSPSLRLGLRYGAILGACVWLVPFGVSALVVKG